MAVSRTVLVTGGSGGIGAEISRGFYENGDKVIIHYNKNEAAAKKLAREIGGEVIQADFSDIKSTTWNKWFSETCILDGLRDSSDILDAFEAGKEPCLKILKKS